MTAYFDDMAIRVRSASEWPYPPEAYEQLEERLVYDVTIAAELPGFPPDLRERVHRSVLRWAVRMLPATAPEPDFEDDAEWGRRLASLTEDLHDIFHDRARRGGSDDPRDGLRVLYAQGEGAREAIVAEGGAP